jgi:hypothetical protein
MNENFTKRKIAEWVPSLLLSLMIFGTVLIANYNQPIIDIHSFRQCQTAISAYWFNWGNPINSLLNYETPLFGVPWKVPFEFPLYQAIVSAVSQFTGLAIHASGRLTSLTFFVLTLLPFASLVKGLGLERRFFFIATIFWLFSPLYLYWSRTVMIESTAVFFGFVFLAALERGVSCKKCYWWLIAFVASLACALVKVTTYPTFGLAAAGILVWKSWSVRITQPKEKENLRRFILQFFGIAFIGLVTVAATSAWTRHADSIKMQNEIAQMLTSNHLSGWNFGTVAQRMDIEIWIKLLSRCIPDLVGSSWVLLILLASIVYLRAKKVLLFAFFIVVFIVPFLLFTNLHIVHNYYQYANGFWLILAIGLVVSEMSKRVNFLFSGLAILLVVFNQGFSYYQHYLPWLTAQTSSAKQLGEFVSQATHPDESVIVVGDGYSSEVAFHSSRRALCISNQQPDELLQKTLIGLRESPSRYFGSHSPSWIVVNRPYLDKYYSESQRKLIDNFLVHNDITSEFENNITLATYNIFKVHKNFKNLNFRKLKTDDVPQSILKYAQVFKPVPDLKLTEELFKCIKSIKLGNTFNVDFQEKGISIIPGSPTEVIFDVKDKYNEIELTACIAELPPAALEDLNNGTVELEIFVDEASIGCHPVDRITNQKYALNLSHAKELKVIVSCTNHGAWDHFYLGVLNKSTK